MDKLAVKAALFEYGKKVGYPDKIGPKEFLEKHLNDSFKFLVKQGLLKKEHYHSYRSAALMQYQLWFMRTR